MQRFKLLIGLVALAYLLFVFFQFNNDDVLACKFDAVILPIITLWYFLYVKPRTLFFSLFLVCYSISDLFVFIEPYISDASNYYAVNSLYVIAYVFLFLEICKSSCFLFIIKNFKIHLIVLMILSVYVVYVLQMLVMQKGSGRFIYGYYIELFYNIIILVLLSASLLNFFYRDNKKALYLFLGILSIVISEVIWIAYIHIESKNLFGIISTTLSIIAFYFLYQQSLIIDSDEENINGLYSY